MSMFFSILSNLIINYGWLSFASKIGSLMHNLTYHYDLQRGEGDS